MSELLRWIQDHEAPFKSQSRLASLYSDFSTLKSSNPDGYRANITAWTTALTHATRAGVTSGLGTLCLKAGDQLAGELQMKSLGRPLALGEVLSEAVSNKVMIPVQEFMSSERSIYDKRWLQFQIPTPWQVARWGLKQIGMGGDKLTEGEFVVLANVEAAATALQSRLTVHQTTPTSQIYSLQTFTATFSDLFSTSTPLTSSDIRILLRHISRDKHFVSTSTDPSSGTTTIKFTTPSISGSSLPSPITQPDTTIATLHTLALNLSSQASTLQTHISTLVAEARVAVASGQRTPALSALRRRKALEATLEKRIASLDQVNAVLNGIDEAAGQVEMVEALEAGGKVLRELNKKVGGVERVEGVMDTLREEMEHVEDVGRVVAEGGEVQEWEIDEEMEALEREVVGKKREEREDVREGERKQGQETEEQKRAEKLAELPNVPSREVLGKTRTEEEEEEKQASRERDVEKRLSTMSSDETVPEAG